MEQILNHIFGTCGEHNHLNIWNILGSFGTVLFMYKFIIHKVNDCYKATCIWCLKLREKEYLPLVFAILLATVVLYIINS